jgi:hypothetical protein
MEEFVISNMDVGPMIVALRTRPADFEMDGSWLHHFPSRHRFSIDREGNVRLDARCDCAILHVQREQGRELWNAFQTWHSAYWWPTEINKEFARHFRTPNIWQRLYRAVRVKFRRLFIHTRLVPASSPLDRSNPVGASASRLSGTALVRERSRLRREAY